MWLTIKVIINSDDIQYETKFDLKGWKMKSVFILAAVVMMFAGCGSNSDGSFGTNSVDGDSVVTAEATVESSTTEVVVSTINEPSKISSLPPVPTFPSE